MLVRALDHRLVGIDQIPQTEVFSVTSSFISEENSDDDLDEK